MMQQGFASIMPITPRPEIIFTQGQGAYLLDNQGKRYLDFVQGWAVNTLGHCPEVISQTFFKQVIKAARITAIL